MNGTGYNSEIKPSAQFFTKEQRQRVEALTVARALKPGGHQDGWVDMATFIFGNNIVFRRDDEGEVFPG